MFLFIHWSNALLDSLGVRSVVSQRSWNWGVWWCRQVSCVVPPRHGSEFKNTLSLTAAYYWTFLSIIIFPKYKFGTTLVSKRGPIVPSWICDVTFTQSCIEMCEDHSTWWCCFPTTFYICDYHAFGFFSPHFFLFIFSRFCIIFSIFSCGRSL